jgi:hypothetical protein
MENAKTTIGSALLPVVLELTTFFSKNVIPIVENLANAFSSKTGGLGESFQDTVKVVQSYVTPIFEGVVSVFNNVKDAIVANIDNFKSFFEVVKFIAPLIGSVIGGALKVIAPIANIVIDIFGAVLGAIKPVLNFVIDSINKIITGINLFSPLKDIPYLSKIGNTASIPKSDLPTITIPTITPSIPSIPSAVATAGSGGMSGSGDKTKKETDGYKPDTQFVDAQLAGLAAQRAGERGDPVASAIASIAAAQAQRAGERGDTIIITNNVSGAIDPESTARTIINTLNNSYYRGTGGANALVMT